LPRVVLNLAAAIVLASATVLVGPSAVSDFIYSACAVPLGYAPGEISQPLGPLAPYVLHVFVHGGWMHLGLNMLGLVAFGAPVARRLHSPLLFLAFFFFTSVVGAATEAQVPVSEPTSMVGASTGAFGLIAASTYVRLAPADGPLPTLLSRPVITGLIPWTAINLILPFVGAGALGYGQVAWAAHLGGLAAGALTFPLFDRLARR
jgi:membrane associated rhomboid family serine protease